MIGDGAPYFYDYINSAVSAQNPSTVHIQNTTLYNYFARYLFQKMISVFKFTLPHNWDIAYFVYTLYSWGYISVIDTEKFGVIPQGCSLQGYDVFYRPTNAVVTNPLITGIKTPRIGTECTLIKMQPDYCGTYDIVSYYASMLALCAETAATNTLNSKLSYVFRCRDNKQAESFKKMFDRIASGEPAVFIDSELKNADDTPVWETFTQDLRANYIAGDILDDMRKWELKFDTEIGIPNANTDKRERLLTDEVNANNFETRAKCELWFDEISRGFDETRKMFNISPDELKIEWREGVRNYGNIVDNGII